MCAPNELRHASETPERGGWSLITIDYFLISIAYNAMSMGACQVECDKVK